MSHFHHYINPLPPSSAATTSGATGSTRTYYYCRPHIATEIICSITLFLDVQSTWQLLELNSLACEKNVKRGRLFLNSNRLLVFRNEKVVRPATIFQGQWDTDKAIPGNVSQNSSHKTNNIFIYKHGGNNNSCMRMWKQQEARTEVHNNDKSGGAGGDVHARLPPGPVVVTPAEHTWRSALLPSYIIAQLSRRPAPFIQMYD